MNNLKKKIFILSCFSAVVLWVCPMLGSEFISWSVLWQKASSAGLDRNIMLMVRLPRFLLGIAAGSSLALSGAVFQSIFRNPLATPYTLGTASGGSLGAVIAIKLGLDFTFGFFSTLSIAAFTGSLLSLLIVYGVGRRWREFSGNTMLLAGVTVSFVFSAVTMFIHYVSDFTQTHRMLIWTMGSLDITSLPLAAGALPAVFAVQLYFFSMGPSLNQISVDDELAHTRGVDVAFFRKRAFFLLSVLIGFTVSLAGPVSFVGLIVPHILRKIFGSDQRVLLPLSSLAGAVFLVLCDTAARLIIMPSEVPAGIITAMTGGTFFIYLLLTRKP
ncbi:MAG: FecCD family ABC transporter permease [Fibrobacterota bacterium]